MSVCNFYISNKPICKNVYMWGVMYARGHFNKTTWLEQVLHAI